MASYRIEVSATAEKQIRAVPRKDQIRILRAIRDLGTDPRPRGTRKLRGHEDVYRIRVGRYRVLYCVEEGVLLVIVLKVGHRKNVYR